MQNVNPVTSRQHSGVFRMTAGKCSARFLRYLFMIFLFLLVFICRSAASDIVANRTVKIGIYGNALKVLTSKEGKPTGIFVDIIEHIAKAEGWKLQYALAQLSAAGARRY